MILSFDNNKHELLVLMLEPWGEQYELKKGDAIKFIFKETNRCEIDIVNCDGYTQVYPGGNSEYPLRIMVNDIEIQGGYGEYLKGNAVCQLIYLPLSRVII